MIQNQLHSIPSIMSCTFQGLYQSNLQQKDSHSDFELPSLVKNFPPGLNLETTSNSTKDNSFDSSPKTLPETCNKFDTILSITNLLENVDLKTFKVFPCPQQRKHDYKQCSFYHYPRDRRRPKHMSLNQFCKYSSNPNSCPKGDSCAYDHSRVEQLYSSDKYKTKVCAHYPDNIKNCEFGSYCSFAHSEDELRVELIHRLDQNNDEFYMFHYKTVWCPFNLIQHDRVSCVYAHNWQDYRRKPREIGYAAKRCPVWEVEAFAQSYKDGKCASMEGCKACHGWKELEYHPLQYKTKKCTLKKCLGGRVCPYYHSEVDKKILMNNSDQIRGLFAHDIKKKSLRSRTDNAEYISICGIKWAPEELDSMDAWKKIWRLEFGEETLENSTQFGKGNLTGEKDTLKLSKIFDIFDSSWTPKLENLQYLGSICSTNSDIAYEGTQD